MEEEKLATEPEYSDGEKAGIEDMTSDETQTTGNNDEGHIPSKTVKEGSDSHIDVSEPAKKINAEKRASEIHDKVRQLLSSDSYSLS